MIDVVHPPYHLIRRGWGEFPARVQIHFKGRSGVNKPVDVMHSIKVGNKNYLNIITLNWFIVTRKHIFYMHIIY